MRAKSIAEKMPTEQTPLIQSVAVDNARERYPHTRLRRYCTIALSTTPIFVVVIILIAFAITGDQGWLGGASAPASIKTFSDSELPHAAWPESEGITYEELRKHLLESPDAQKAREWSKYYSAGPHLAGKNLSQAEWTRDRWLEFGTESAEVVAYEVYINYPLEHALSLVEDGKVVYRASLEEDVLDEDPTTSLPDRVPTFHGYSASGNVTASFVYANYGTYADYEDLIDAGISIEGKIVLVKYGQVFRGLKVKRASELGAVGVVMYDDPGEDGEITEKNGMKAYPDGPARNPSSVQRGSVQYLSFAPGDPTTIGYPSKPGAPRQPVDGKIPDIPSLPISYQDALPILKALNGHGPNASSLGEWWTKGGLGYKGVNYNIGPSSKSLTLNLVNKQEYVTTPLWNVIGVINGTISDEVIVIGNHRDAWIAGGAGDPNSGSAALNEVVRSFGEALKAGWKPHRTLVFASWDGEEYGLLGSTEWVEEYLPWLRDSTVAYINVDVAARGHYFRPAAAPVLSKAINEVIGQVQSPNQTIKGQTVRDLWDGRLRSIGSGSDFTAFQDFAGIPSFDVGYAAGPSDPVYHYHSNYDSFYWMDKHGDPGFQYHITITKVIALLAAKLVEEPVIQFNATDYAVSLEKYLKSVVVLAQESDFEVDTLSPSFDKLEKAINFFQEASVEFDAKAQRLEEHVMSSSSASRTSAVYRAIRSTNKKYKYLERQFLYGKGLDERHWFKHVVFAPGRWTGYSGATFPGLVEAIEDHDTKGVRRWASIISDRIYSAGKLLLKE